MKDQRGFSFLEVLIGIALTSLMMGVLATGVFRLAQGFDQKNAQIAVSRRIDDAIAFVSADVRNARYTNLTSGAAAVSTVTLEGTDYYAESLASHKAVYSLSGSNLQRAYDGGTASTIGKSISSIQFSVSGNELTVVITAADTRGSVSFSDSKTFRYRLRAAP